MWDEKELLKIKTNLQNINTKFSKIANDERLPFDDLSEVKLAIRYIRNSCSSGEVQDYVIEQPETLEFIKYLTDEELPNDGLVELAWQFLANLSVQNKKSQSFIWSTMGEKLLEDLRTSPLDSNTDKKLMMIYNMCIDGLPECDDKVCLALLADLWNKINEEESNEDLVYVDLFFEYFLVNNQWTVRAYAALSAQNRIDVLKYMVTYIGNDSPNGAIRRMFMEYLAKEFKKKSDCILASTTNLGNVLHPQEVYQLLHVLASASGSEVYQDIFSQDGSLFLSVGALMKSIVALGKKDNNQFTPMTKLEQVAPNSKISTEFESEVSFQLKTLLVRTIANLLYTNPGNQRHCLDISLMPALLESTVMDARNPLMREWSILAIRNACANCPEIQELIANLTQTGVAPNELLTELNIDIGSLRIQKKE